eukprot:TRINITY_DN5836_c3_g1_i1.p2 TRINITY_DN5836_c3_g1~~TRINITY_DN5836_c3_g1_i1.p2  ORF type:complete len:125 (+),score=11.93 TRINITY_DN5836_c3_g1_i1:373-747(+)
MWSFTQPNIDENVLVTVGPTLTWRIQPRSCCKISLSRNSFIRHKAPDNWTAHNPRIQRGPPRPPNRRSIHLRGPSPASRPQHRGLLPSHRGSPPAHRPRTASEAGVALPPQSPAATCRPRASTP